MLSVRTEKLKVPGPVCFDKMILRRALGTQNAVVCFKIHAVVKDLKLELKPPPIRWRISNPEFLFTFQKLSECDGNSASLKRRQYCVGPVSSTDITLLDHSNIDDFIYVD